MHRDVTDARHFAIPVSLKSTYTLLLQIPMISQDPLFLWFHHIPKIINAYKFIKHMYLLYKALKETINHKFTDLSSGVEQTKYNIFYQ